MVGATRTAGGSGVKCGVGPISSPVFEIFFALAADLSPVTEFSCIELYRGRRRSAAPLSFARTLLRIGCRHSTARVIDGARANAATTQDTVVSK
jgi:hypothetical protein